MIQTILYAIIALSGLGAFSAIVIYFVAQKFKVIEDPRIDQVQELLAGANCGGCGYPGCRGFAEACVNAENLDALSCPPGGNETMAKVAAVLGKVVSDKEPIIAVIRCSGSFDKRPKTNNYDGATSCQIASALYSGQTGCSFGCLGLGDCVTVCRFDAIFIDEKTGLPVVDNNKCTACGACVKACPKLIIELRLKGKKDRRIFVSCINKDKGGLAKKNCSVACIGCGKCMKECLFEAITIDKNLSYIDFDKCKLCRKCVAVCPTGAIHEINFSSIKVEA